jgi:NAD(P)H-dependent FMN reductase
MSVLALSTSAVPDSLNYRGLLLLDKHCGFDKVDCLSNYDIPVVNVNGIEEQIPKSVTAALNEMYKHEKFVFAIPEFTGMMSSSTKNLLDWLVVTTNMNLEHGKGYPFTDKHVIILTFTPSGDEGGSRHFEETKEIFKKLGANVTYMECFNDCWNTVVPGNEQHFEEAGKRIKNYLSYEEDNSGYFKNKYIKWNTQWKNYAN